MTTSLDDPADGFRGQCRAARSNCSKRCAAPARRAAADLHLDQQGLRRDRRHGAGRAPTRATCRRAHSPAPASPRHGRCSSTAPMAARKAPPTNTCSIMPAATVCPTAVFRMSCIYGPHQHGTEDQGWVAHFLIRALQGRPITIYGDGKQVRDLLYVDDLVDALLLAEQHLIEIAGQAFNIGGGPGQYGQPAGADRTDRGAARRASRSRIRRLAGRRPALVRVRHAQIRPATGWRPRVGVAEGIRRLYDWLLAASAAQLRCSAAEAGRVMRIALVNPPWSFDGSIYFGCREPHLPLEYGYAKALLERGRTRGAHLRRACSRRSTSPELRRRRSPAFRPDMTRRHDGAELSVLALRAAGTAGAATRRSAALAASRGTTVAVGPHGSTTPRATLRKLGVDAVVIGECEEVLRAPGRRRRAAMGRDRRPVPPRRRRRSSSRADRMPPT